MRVLLCLLLSLITLPRAGEPQDSPTSQHYDQQSHISCERAYRLLIAEAAGGPVDTSLYRFDSRSDSDDLLRQLTDLALDSPRCPAAYGARGLVKQRLAVTDWVPKDLPGQRVGVPWREGALYDLIHAAKGGGPAAVAATAIATRLLLPDKVEMPYMVRELGPTLLAIPAAASEVPDTIRYILRGRLAAWLWQPGTADSAFSAYLAAGGHYDRAMLELARVRLGVESRGADTLYYRAAASSDSLVMRELRSDLTLIADSQELAAFDRLTAADRSGWLRRFWEQRDLESLKPRGSRLRAHYTRIAVARRKFRLLSYPRHYELNELWINRDAEYDDRGLVYIRHGKPDRTVSAVRPGACPNTSWLYRRPEGNLIFHFVARQNPDDWRMVETLANVAGESGATTRLRRAGSARSCGSVDGLLESRMPLDRIYSELAGNQTRRNWERELALTTKSREIGTTTDSDRLRFASALEVDWRAYGLLGTQRRGGRALVLVSVPAGTLEPISLQPLAYQFRMRMVARSGGRTVEIDTVRSLGAPQAAQPGQMITFITDVPLPAGPWRLGVALEQPSDSAGEVILDSLVPVPDPGSRTLVLSDIVLGDATGGRPWMSPDGPFPLSATGTYVQGEPIPLYYEIAGGRSGAEVETEITFVREDGKGKSTIRFTEPVSGSIDRVQRELNTSKSRPGRYLLTIAIKSGDGRRATRQTWLSVAPRDK